jgi:predicted dehydrogenase
MAEFARAIVEGAAVETDAASSLQAVACAEAALRSARSGRREAVEQIGP